MIVSDISWWPDFDLGQAIECSLCALGSYVSGLSQSQMDSHAAKMNSQSLLFVSSIC